MLGEPSKTSHGFQKQVFTDTKDRKCSVQASSLFDDSERGMNNPGSSFLLIGIEDAEPMFLASKAGKVGVDTDETVGWIPFPVPRDVMMTTRMHLNREQVKDLICTLSTWLATGGLEPISDEQCKRSVDAKQT